MFFSVNIVTGSLCESLPAPFGSLEPPAPPLVPTSGGPGGESRVRPGGRSGRIVGKREAEGEISVPVKTDRKEPIWTHKSPGLTCKHSLAGEAGAGRLGWDPAAQRF